MIRRTTPAFLTRRAPWITLASVALLMELFALFSQHVWGMEPCNECIYIRFGVLGLLVAGLVGTVAPWIGLVRAFSLMLAGGGLAFALQRTVILVGIERDVEAGAVAGCRRFHGFPAWLDLQKWLPEMFEPRGKCGEILGTFLGQSFAVWSLIGLSVLGVAAVVILIRDFKRP